VLVAHACQEKIAIITLKILGTTVQSVGTGADGLDSKVHDGFIKPINQALRVWSLFLFSNSNVVFATALTEFQGM